MLEQQFYIIIDEKHPEIHQQVDEEGMQEFLIHRGGMEGVLYHSEMTRIKILYDVKTGEVRLVDIEQKPHINFDYTNIFQSQRKQVELAIRRLVKLDLLAELNRMNDSGVCAIITRNHDIEKETGKICSNTSEIALDMTLVKIIKLGYFKVDGGMLRQFLSGLMGKKQTQVQRAIYTAFEDFKKSCENSSQALNQFKSKVAVTQFIGMIEKYL